MATDRATPQTHDLTPGGATDRAFRDALSRFGTGVTIVTANTADGPRGITVNSFTSVSLDPPLVLWSASLGSRRYPHFSKAQDIAIHVLAEDQHHICDAFSRSHNAFEGLHWHESARGVPLIDDCLARFECSKVAEHDGGDHAIIVSRVHRLTMRDGAPLLFFGGSFGGFASPE